MKKVVKFFAAAAIGLPLVFNSCASEDPAKPVELDLSQTGTFKVTILAVTDRSVTDQTFVPAPIKAEHIVAYVPYYDLSPIVNDGNYFIPKQDIKYDETTGVLEITVPTVYNKMVSLYVDILEASGECKVEVDGKSKTVKGKWYIWEGQMSVSLMPCQNIFYGTVYMGFFPEGAKVGDEV